MRKKKHALASLLQRLHLYIVVHRRNGGALDPIIAKIFSWGSEEEWRLFIITCVLTLDDGENKLV